jgi:hypothetical protein
MARRNHRGVELPPHAEPGPYPAPARAIVQRPREDLKLAPTPPGISASGGTTRPTAVVQRHE